MKSQQLSLPSTNVDEPRDGSFRCAALPTLTTVVLAIASSLVLTLAGCAGSELSAANAQMNVPTSASSAQSCNLAA